MRDESSVVETSPLFGRWSYDFVHPEWRWSEDMMAMFAADLSNPGDVDVIFSRIHPEDRDAISERLERALATRTAISGQYRFDSPHRGLRTFSFVGTPVVDGSGQVVRLDGFTIDVTVETAVAAREAVDGATLNRAAIEQVKGALMATYGMSEEFAFEALRHLSMHHNVKLSALAVEVVDRLSSDGVGLALVTDDAGQGRAGGPVIEMLQAAAADLASARGEGASTEDAEARTNNSRADSSRAN